MIPAPVHEDVVTLAKETVYTAQQINNLRETIMQNTKKPPTLQEMRVVLNSATALGLNPLYLITQILDGTIKTDFSMANEQKPELGKHLTGYQLNPLDPQNGTTCRLIYTAFHYRGAQIDVKYLGYGFRLPFNKVRLYETLAAYIFVNYVNRFQPITFSGQWITVTMHGYKMQVVDTCLVKKTPEGIQEDLDALLDQMDYRDKYAEFMQTEIGNVIHAVRLGETVYPPIYAECLQVLVEEMGLEVEPAGDPDSAGLQAFRWAITYPQGDFPIKKRLEREAWRYPGADVDYLLQDIIDHVDPLTFPTDENSEEHTQEG